MRKCLVTLQKKVSLTASHWRLLDSEKSSFRDLSDTPSAITGSFKTKRQRQLDSFIVQYGKIDSKKEVENSSVSEETINSGLNASQTLNSLPPVVVAKSELKALPKLNRNVDEKVRVKDTKTVRNASYEDDSPFPLCLQHPAELFDDESSILHRFGMGGRASPPHIPGFTGYFRQHWKDFHVTEMVQDSESESGGICVSRAFTYTVPELPLPDPSVSSSYNSQETVDPLFFSVDVKKRLREINSNPQEEKNLFSTSARLCEGTETYDDHDDNTNKTMKKASEDDAAKFYLECTLHKQHVAHSTAMSLIAQSLRIHPSCISSAGMKDFIGDTVQRIRIHKVSPLSALQANRIFKKKGFSITLSNFSYAREPLLPGDLFGNHFKIVLRDVQASKSTIQEAVKGFVENGFPNYYGSQRFSWFGGTEDAAFALLTHNPLIFVFRFLNYTSRPRSLRELLQRPKKYPHPVQDQYRRNVVRRLRRLSINPSELDQEPFLSCPSMQDSCEGSGDQYSAKQKLIFRELWESYLDLDLQSRRPTAQRLSSYLWNQVLTLRLHHFGGKKVLLGDHCIPMSVRRLAAKASDRTAINYGCSVVATPETINSLSISDVVHPGFSFENHQLPENAIGKYYFQICEKYHLNWSSRHSRGRLRDFMDPPRPIIRHPIHFKYEHLPELGQLTLDFALERGCYANVAVTELMKLSRCAGSEDIQGVPAPDVMWDSLGDHDPGYVTTLQDIYPNYVDGDGVAREYEGMPVTCDTVGKIWDHQGPFFLPKHQDPYVIASKWGRQHLLRSTQRRELDIAEAKRRLFEKPLARTVSDEDIPSYGGHTVPLGPNARKRSVQRALSRRLSRYPGAPKMIPRFERKVRRNVSFVKARPEYSKLNSNSWNVMW